MKKKKVKRWKNFMEIILQIFIWARYFVELNNWFHDMYHLLYM